MIKSTITELTRADVQANLERYELTSFNWPTIFPLKAVPTPEWKAIEGVAGAPVAADIVSMDATAPRKMRPRVQGTKGEIPKTSIAREKMESEIYDYYLLKQGAAATGDTTALFEWIYEDDEFCFIGVATRMEWLALRAASTGKVSVDNTNNDGNVVSEYVTDFLIPTENKSGVTTAITVANKTTSKPITMLKGVTKAAKAKGVILKYAFMDQDTLDNILISDETVKMVAPFILQATQLTQTPSRAQLQAYLTSELNGLRVVIIESYITLEVDSIQTTVAPWEPGVILFSETAELGKTVHAPLAEEHASFSTAAIKAKRENVMIKKYAVEEPFKEVTLAQSISFPVLANSRKKWLVDTLNTTWTK